jgi:hypothetical protein
MDLWTKHAITLVKTTIDKYHRIAQSFATKYYAKIKFAYNKTLLSIAMSSKEPNLRFIFMIKTERAVAKLSFKKTIHKKKIKMQKVV